MDLNFFYLTATGARTDGRTGAHRSGRTDRSGTGPDSPRADFTVAHSCSRSLRSPMDRRPIGVTVGAPGYCDTTDYNSGVCGVDTKGSFRWPLAW